MHWLWGRRPRLRRAPLPGLDFTGRRRPANAPAAGRGPAPLHELFGELRTLLFPLVEFFVFVDLDDVTLVGGADDALQLPVIQPVERAVLTRIDNHVAGAAVGVRVHFGGALRALDVDVQVVPFGLL